MCGCAFDRSRTGSQRLSPEPLFEIKSSGDHWSVISPTGKPFISSLDTSDHNPPMVAFVDKPPSTRTL